MSMPRSSIASSTSRVRSTKAFRSADMSTKRKVIWVVPITIARAAVSVGSVINTHNAAQSVL